MKETNNNNEEDVVVYVKFLALKFGVNEEAINREAVRERIVGKDPKKFVEVVRSAQEVLKDVQKKKPDKDGDYGVGIALNKMLNVPKAPSAANPTLEELQQLAFAQPEKVETESEPPKKNWYVETKKKMLEMFQSEAGKGQCDAFVKMYQDRFSGMLTEDLEKVLPVFETCMDDAKKAAEKTQGGGTLSRDALDAACQTAFDNYDSQS